MSDSWKILDPFCDQRVGVLLCYSLENEIKDRNSSDVKFKLS